MGSSWNWNEIPTNKFRMGPDFLNEKSAALVVGESKEEAVILLNDEDHSIL